MPLAYRDTVASVGVLVGRTLPFVAANDTIRWFRQALALDEVRVEVWSLADLLGHNGPIFYIMAFRSCICHKLLPWWLTRASLAW